MRIVHLPVRAATWAARAGRVPGLTPYAVEQVARGGVLDTTRARATGWEPRWEPDAVLGL
ncbi:hypothetical protein LN042_17435 [Kitasatospora sp. RB6PN24]|uniref:hypothetical protein n=1 Tax=Kitasatospora humi TaxID=2893891 RepID=UPI001E3BB4AC|nr:hypothetical protein [Kitasatospora humi]MCC9308847.1 hypothetical protein [Kitasatospora humi]